MKKLLTYLLFLGVIIDLSAQEIISLDTNNWKVTGSFLIENYKGKDAVYLKGGSITLKNRKFKNGTIEFDIFLKETQAFPGVYFRVSEQNAEQFYVRPHQSGNPDANQAAPLINGISAWQLYFGTRYSFPYEYRYDDWTHVKIIVNEGRAQVFLDYSETANLSWNLFLEPVEGDIVLRGGGAKAIHIADVRVDESSHEISDFNPIEREPIEGLVSEWEISDKFEEKDLNDPTKLDPIISARTWGRKIQVEEGTAANISRQQQLKNGEPGNTVFTKITFTSDKDQIKLFDFGYSDRVVAILNGEAIYRGNNKWRSRDYRYLGTIGLFDSIYLNLKKGENTLLMAVSEDFGGWLITGKFADQKGIKISY